MNLGMSEMMFIFLLALILFGPKKLPEIGREIGRFMAALKRTSNDFKDQFQSEMEKAGVDAVPSSQPEAQQASSFTQALVPPAATSAIAEIDSAYERLVETTRVAVDDQKFTLLPSEAGVDAPVQTEALSLPERVAARQEVVAP